MTLLHKFYTICCIYLVLGMFYVELHLRHEAVVMPKAMHFGY